MRDGRVGVEFSRALDGLPVSNVPGRGGRRPGRAPPQPRRRRRAAAPAPRPPAWLNLGAAGSGQAITIDASSLEQEGSTRTAWFRMTDPAPAPPSLHSYRLQDRLRPAHHPAARPSPLRRGRRHRRVARHRARGGSAAADRKRHGHRDRLSLLLHLKFARHGLLEYFGGAGLARHLVEKSHVCPRVARSLSPPSSPSPSPSRAPSRTARRGRRGSSASAKPTPRSAAGFATSGAAARRRRTTQAKQEARQVVDRIQTMKATSAH